MHYRDIESGGGGGGPATVEAAAGVTSGYRRSPLVVALSNGAWHEEYLSTPHKRVGGNSDRFPAAKSASQPMPVPQQQPSFVHAHPSPKARDPSSFSNLKPDSTMTTTPGSSSKLSRSPSSLSRSPTVKSNIDSLSNLSDAASRSFEAGLGAAGAGSGSGMGREGSSSRSFDKNVGLAREASMNRAILMGDISLSSSGGSSSSPMMMMMQPPPQQPKQQNHHHHHHHHGCPVQPPERRFDAQALVPPLVLVTVPFVWWYVKGSPYHRLGFRPAEDVALWYWFDFLALLAFFTALVVSARLAFPQLSVMYKAPPPPTLSLAARAVLGQSWDSLSSGLLKPLAALLSEDRHHLQKKKKKQQQRKESSSLLPVAAQGSSKVTWTIGSSGGAAATKSSKSPPQQAQHQREKEKFFGEGVQTYSNGDIYEGEFHEGRCSGSGVYYFYMSGRYEGEWVDGKYDGYGVETWARGSRYRGQYSRGLRDGYGVYRFYTGDIYSGEWSNGQSHGSGTQTCEDGSRYRGEFKWGVKHGFGFYRFRNGDTYAGEYFADKMHGYGVYQFANGHRYEGSWHEGRKQGLGIYTFRNGETHAGHWHHGSLETRSSQNPTPGSHTAVYHSKVLNAVQEARRASAKAMDVSRVEDRVNKAVTCANRSANAARVAAVKAVQKRNSSPLYADRV